MSFGIKKKITYPKELRASARASDTKKHLVTIDALGLTIQQAMTRDQAKKVFDFALALVKDRGRESGPAEITVDPRQPLPKAEGMNQ